MNRRCEMLSIEHTLMCLVRRNMSQIIARPWGHSSQLDDVLAITDDAGNEVAPAQETPGSCRYSCPFSECCGIALDGFSKWQPRSLQFTGILEAHSECAANGKPAFIPKDPAFKVRKLKQIGLRFIGLIGGFRSKFYWVLALTRGTVPNLVASCVPAGFPHVFDVFWYFWMWGDAVKLCVPAVFCKGLRCWRLDHMASGRHQSLCGRLWTVYISKEV